MIFDKFKRKNVKRKIEKDLCNLKKEEVHSDLKVGSILIFANDRVEKKNFEVLAKELNVDQKNLKVIVFKENVDNKILFENEITSKDFGLFGTFKNKGVQKILKTQVDLLVNYVQENYYVNMLVLDSNASFKIGISNENNPLYNLMIDVDSLNVQDYNSEIRKYLKILKKI